MRARENPNTHQMLRRMRRAPKSDKDLRYVNDGYWALRRQGYSHSYAIRAYRDETPKLIEHTVLQTPECASEDILFPVGSTFTTLDVKIRPALSDEVVSYALPRPREYTIWDEAIPGFGLRVRPSGFKSFIVVYRLPARNSVKKTTIGRVGEVELDHAKRVARQMLATLKNFKEPLKTEF